MMHDQPVTQGWEGSTPQAGVPREPLKVLYHHRTRSKDGQAVHIEGLVGALKAEGCDVTIVEPSAADETEFGGESRVLDSFRRLLPKSIYELLELAYNVPAYLRLRRAYLRTRPDVIYERYNLYLLAGAWLHKRFRVPLVLEVNAPLFKERQSHGGIGLQALAKWAEKFAWRSADYVLPVTNVLGSYVAAVGVPRERVIVIPNGINPAEFAGTPSTVEAKAALGLAGKFVLGFAGFVRSWHGIDQIVDYIARPGHEHAFLLIVGDGPVRDEIEKRAAVLGVAERVRFTGVVHRDRVPLHLAAFDVALQPAATEYASPLKIFEYLALGLTIVAPAQANILEILKDGENALLFRPGETSALFAALDRLMADPELRNRISRGAAATVGRGDYTWRANAVRVIELARRLASRSGTAKR